jgi:hypothetical protein
MASENPGDFGNGIYAEKPLEAYFVIGYRLFRLG